MADRWLVGRHHPTLLRSTRPTVDLPRRLESLVTAAVSGGTIVLTGLAVAAPATAAPAMPLSDCVSSDNGDPVRSGLTISTHLLDIPGRPGP
jgi:hypothetical protein